MPRRKRTPPLTPEEAIAAGTIVGVVFPEQVADEPAPRRRRAKPDPNRVPPPEAVVNLGPSGRYTPRLLCEVYRWCRANPGGRVAAVAQIGGWLHDERSAEEWLSWFSRCLAAKVTAADPRRPVGRKSEGEYQTELYRLRNYVGNRLVCNWVAPVLGGRVRNAMARRLARAKWR